jgi:hypothetical protein
MVEHDQSGSASSLAPTPQDLKGLRPTSAAAQLDSEMHVHPDNDSSRTASATTSTTDITPQQRGHVRHHGASKSVSYGPSHDASTSPHPIYRTGEWKSRDLSHIDEVSKSLLMDRPLKKTSFPGRRGLQPQSASAPNYQNPLLKSPIFMRDQGTQTAGPPLSLKVSVQHVQTSPTVPQLKIDPLSPVSIGPQSGNTSPDSTTVPRQEQWAGHNELPTYVSALEFALRPFLDTIDDTHEQHLRLPAPAQQSDSIPDRAPLVVPGRQLSNTDYESDEEEEDVPEYGIPSHVMDKDVFRTRMRQIQLRTLLMHCTVLQTTASDLEHTPWKTDNKHSPHWYYEKIRSLVYKARPLAEALESKDLQARCEYWAGRGCGGTRDYQAAEAHFDSALKLDVPNDTSRSGKARLRGLLPTEKADVRFLRDSCSTRHKAWEKRTTRAFKRAERQAEETGIPLEACLEEDLIQSPPWMPDRDRAVQLARQAFDDHNGTCEEADRKELQPTDKMMLSKKEWQYIKHGDVQMAQQRARQQSAEQNQKANDTTTHRKDSRVASTITSRKTSRLASGTTDGTTRSRPYRQSLANELEGLETLEWERSPTESPPDLQGSAYESDQWSPTGPHHVNGGSAKPVKDGRATRNDMPGTSVSPTGLRQRRHIDLDPIITEDLQSQSTTGDAVLSASPPSNNLLTSVQPLKKQATSVKAKQTSSPLSQSIDPPSSPALDQRPNPKTTRQTPPPVPAPLQSAPLAPPRRTSLLLPPTIHSRTRSFSSVTSDARPLLASATRSRPVTVFGDLWTGHRHTPPSDGPLNGSPWDYSAGIGNQSPTMPGSPYSPMLMPV